MSLVVITTQLSFLPCQVSQDADAAMKGDMLSASFQQPANQNIAAADEQLDDEVVYLDSVSDEDLLLQHRRFQQRRRQRSASGAQRPRPASPARPPQEGQAPAAGDLPRQSDDARSPRSPNRRLKAAPRKTSTLPPRLRENLAAMQQAMSTRYQGAHSAFVGCNVFGTNRRHVLVLTFKTM